MKDSGRAHIIRIWLAIMGVATLVIGASYAMVQQSTRLAADDLPLTTAQTVRNQLADGTSPQDVLTAKTVDLRYNDNVFVIIADNDHHVIAGSATLDGQTPLPPAGTFDYTSAHGSDRFTWEPQPGVRLATHMLPYGQAPNSGFVITGQSLKPYEDRIDVYTELALAAWLASLAWTVLTLILPALRRPVRKKK